MPQYNFRHNWSYHSWVKQLTEKGHEAVLVSEVGTTFKEMKIINPGPDYLVLERKGTGAASDRNRGMKRMLGIEYFLNHTLHDWHWSTCDDVSIDINAVDDMINELNSKYDPNKDIVFIGHCIVNRIPYLQGGSGFIVSRAAARILASYGHEWVNSINTYDDMEFHKLREKLGLTVAQTSSPYMLGHAFTFPIQRGFWNKTYPKCPKTTQAGQCNYGSYPIKTLVGYHISNPTASAIVMNDIIDAKKNDPTLKYYYNTLFMNFCRD